MKPLSIDELMESLSDFTQSQWIKTMGDNGDIILKMCWVDDSLKLENILIIRDNKIISIDTSIYKDGKPEGGILLAGPEDTSRSLKDIFQTLEITTSKYLMIR